VRSSWLLAEQISCSVARIQHLVGPPVLIQGGIVVWSTWGGLGKAFEASA
jgi:hypothetical protein